MKGQPIMDRIMRAALAAVVAAWAVGQAGCSSEPATGVVAGVVTLNGKAVETGTVSILSPTSGVPVMAGIGQGGKYRAEGVPVGPVTLTVTDYQEAAAGSADDFKKRGPGAVAEPKNNFPAKYADHATSGLGTTVTTGETVYDVQMRK
jgi:hypothetical protein